MQCGFLSAADLFSKIRLLLFSNKYFWININFYKFLSWHFSIFLKLFLNTVLFFFFFLQLIHAPSVIPIVFRGGLTLMQLKFYEHIGWITASDLLKGWRPDGALKS